MLDSFLIIEIEDLKWLRVGHQQLVLLDPHRVLVPNDVEETGEDVGHVTALPQPQVKARFLDHESEVVAQICLLLRVQHEHVLVCLLLCIVVQLYIDVCHDHLRDFSEKIKRAFLKVT